MPRALTDYEQTMKPVVEISGRDGGVAEYDNMATTTKVTINYPHHKVHEGDTFQSSYKSPDASPLADNANLDILIIVGAVRPHLTFEGACGGDAEVLLYEATTVSANGVRLADANLNRNELGKGPTVATYQTPTVTVAGNQLAVFLQPGGTKNQATGGTTRANTEWILRTNTTYLLRLTNRAGNAQPASLAVQWYEK